MQSRHAQLRDGAHEFFMLLEQNDIPLIIMSSSGLGIDSIAMFLEAEHEQHDNVHIISNHYTWDENGKATAVQEPIIHGMNKDETKEDAMTRELLEETGYRGEIEFVVEILPDAYSTYTKNFFVITNCEKISEPQIEDNGEEVEVVLMNLEAFRTHLRTGQMTNIEGAYLCLDYLNLL